MQLLNLFLASLFAAFLKAPEPLNIEGASYIDKKYYEVVSEKEFLENFNITGYAATYSFVPSLNFNLLGETEYILHVENNTYFAEKAFILNVVDDLKPCIKGPDIIYLKKGKDIRITNILDYFKGYDDFDGWLDVYISDFDKNKLLEEGEGFLELYCEDRAKNIAYTKVKIYIISNAQDLFIYQNQTINLEKGNVYSAFDIVEKLKENNYIENISNYTATFLGENTVDFSRVGKYEVTIEIKYLNAKYEIKIVLNLKEKEEKRETMVYRIIKFLKNIFNRIHKVIYEK